MHVEDIKIDWTPELSIYASEKFLKAVGDEYGWLGGFDDSGALRCILPYTIVSRPFLRAVRFRIQTIPIQRPLSLAEEKEFLNGVVKCFRSRNADLILPPTTNTIFRTFPDGAVTAPYGSYIMELGENDDLLFAKLSSSHRRKVRLAKKAGVEIKEGLQYSDTVYELVRATFKRSSLGFMSIEAFRRLLRHLEENVKVLVAEHRGVIQGGIVVPFSLHSAYYLYGGSQPEPETGAMQLLHWEAMCTFRGLGVKLYDFVGVRINPDPGSKQEGLMQFKQRFGGRLAEGCMWKYSFHRPKYLVYSSAMRLLRGGDIIDQERRRLRQRSSKAHSDSSHREDKSRVIWSDTSPGL